MKFRPNFLLFLLACAAACLAVSSQSLWVDEVETAFKAAQPTLHSWWDALYVEHNSNMQLPLYMVYIWGWARLFGISELALRSANVPWFFLGFFAIHHFLRRRPGFRNAALLVYCIHPFVWCYLNEARSYLMQLSGALLAAGALFDALDAEDEPLPTSWWWLYLTGITILCGTGLLGIPWALAVSVLLTGRAGFRGSMFRSGLAPVLLLGPVLVVLAIYFAWTLEEGARPGETGMGLASIPFVFYEHFGFMGLGPGRVAMRSGGVGIFVRYVPFLCILGIPLAYALARAGAARFGLSPTKIRGVCLVVLIPAAFVFALGFTKHFLVLGRHLTPLFPFILGAIAFSLSLLWARGKLLDRAVAALIIVALAASALECRFAYRHQKDDNKDAAAVARAALARGEEVWWVADIRSAVYYRLPCSETAKPGSALLLWRPTLAQIPVRNAPSLIMLSKPDLFDTNFGVRDFIKEQGYAQTGAFPSFSVWSR